MPLPNALPLTSDGHAKEGEGKDLRRDTKDASDLLALLDILGIVYTVLLMIHFQAWKIRENDEDFLDGLMGHGKILF